MDRKTDEFRLLLGMVGVTLATATLLLMQLWDSGLPFRP